MVLDVIDINFWLGILRDHTGYTIVGLSRISTVPAVFVYCGRKVPGENV
jgi:hypothetical protein